MRNINIITIFIIIEVLSFGFSLNVLIILTIKYGIVIIKDVTIA